MVPTPKEKIRQLFLHPLLTYSLEAAARVLGIEEHELRGWVDSGEIEAIESAADLMLPWSEVVAFAMDWWEQSVIEEALGVDVVEVIPELLRLTALEVRLPRLNVVALERVAARDGRSIDSVLARELRDFVSVHAPWLSLEVSGFAEAFAWPEGA